MSIKRLFWLLLLPTLLYADPLLDLLDLAGVDHDGTPAGIVEATQAAWLRRPGTERESLVDPPHYQEQRAAFLELFDTLGLVEEVAPTKSQYDATLWLGAKRETAQKRLDYLRQVWDGSPVYLLAGERPLEPDEGEGQWETEMMLHLWGAAPIHVVHALRGSKSRPNTADTYRLWQASSPPPGLILAISNQPYVLYQQAVGQSELSGDYQLETVGPRAPPDLPIAVYLDTLARLLYLTLKS